MCKCNQLCSSGSTFRCSIVSASCSISRVFFLILLLLFISLHFKRQKKKMDCFVILFLCLHLASEVSGSVYIVHMDELSMPKVFASREKWHLNCLQSAARMANPELENPPTNLIYSYQHVFQGFSAELSPQELHHLKKQSGYLSAYPDKTGKLDTTYTYKFLSLNTASGLWPASNFGKDVTVGVIDSGVWPESPSFKDDGMAPVPSRWKGKCDGGYGFNSSLCNRKLVGVRYYNNGVLAAAAAASPVNILTRETKFSARDGEGHGTHTSSTIAGNYVDGASSFGYAGGKARGIAPRARLAIYKVSWEGSPVISESDVLAAMDQAVDDGVDVISLSLGFDGYRLWEDPIAIASFAAIQKNKFVSCSAGNSGEQGLGYLHNGIPWVLTAAASSTDRWFSGTLTLEMDLQ